MGGGVVVDIADVVVVDFVVDVDVVADVDAVDVAALVVVGVVHSRGCVRGCGLLPSLGGGVRTFGPSCGFVKKPCAA